MMTDIEIAQQCAMKPITEIAVTAHVDEKYLEQYGRYKAKIDLSLLREMSGKFQTGGEADAGRAAGDHDDFVFQSKIKCHGLFLLIWVCLRADETFCQNRLLHDLDRLVDGIEVAVLHVHHLRQGEQRVYDLVARGVGAGVERAGTN